MLAQDGNKMLSVGLDLIEKLNTGTSKTKNLDFEKNGFLFLKNFVDVSNLVELPTEDFRNNTQWNRADEISNALSRYKYIKYKETQFLLKKQIEDVIKCDLQCTYFYDRFYFEESELGIHLDRPACEISISLNISANPKNLYWPLYIKGCDQVDAAFNTEPGDAVLYKGCERPHWRNKFESLNLANKERMPVYCHQAFFHFVLTNGSRIQFSNDFV